MPLCAIADDVTGGTDLASLLRRVGLTVVQTLGLPRGALPAADAVVVSLKTRMAPAGVAVEQAVAAAGVLAGAGASQLYFKYCSTFDSTDAGNIGPVIEGLLEALSVPLTVACPAYPALGRTVYQGHLFVGSRLLSESSMRDHPLTPMTDADLVRVLGRQARHAVALVPLADVERGAGIVRDRLAGLAEAGCRIAIVDAIFDGHVDTVATACADLPLVTGGAALGGALGRSRSLERRAAIPRPSPPAPGGRIVLSGSCSEATRAQVGRLAARVPSRALDPLRLVDDAGELGRVIDWGVAQARRGSVLIYSTDQPEIVSAVQARVGRAQAAALLEQAFGSIAAALAAAGARTFVVAGGETAGAVLESLGIRTLAFDEDLEPGVPWARSLDPEGFTFALKSGNFGSRDLLLKAVSEAS